MNISKATPRSGFTRHRVHVASANKAPLCGGGNSARSTNWQWDISECNCARCKEIQRRRAMASFVFEI